MAIQTSEKGRIFNEINITPLTDIFLVLLIIMMVMAPMFQSVDKNIKVPKINSGINVPEGMVTVSITKNAQYYLDGNSINPSALTDKLAEVIGKSKDKVVIVRADSSTKSKEILNVMKAAQAAGYEKLTVAGEPLSKTQQDSLQQNKNNQDG